MDSSIINPQVSTLNPPPAQPASQPKQPVNRKGRLSKVLVIFGIIVLFGGSCAGSYLYGKSKVAPATATTSTTNVSLKVPDGATITAQCAVGRGTQYIMPKDIPYGPIYNVLDGKVIGIEYMVPKDSLPTVAGKMISYSLQNNKYDHIEVGVIPEGHAGFTMTHYHLDFFNVPESVTSAITCNNTTPASGASPTASPEMHM